MPKSINTFSDFFNFHENKLYLKLSLIFCVIWLICSSPLRYLIHTENLAIIILLGSAPNFFAGIALVLWQTYAASTGVLYDFIFPLIILCLCEFVQVFMDHNTADWFDVIAGLFGCTVGIFIRLLIERRTS